MGGTRHVGRAPVRLHVGKARVGRAVGVAATPERAATAMLKVDTDLPPVFVDASGRRRRGLRRLAYGVGIAALLLLLLLWLSQLGGAMRPDPVSPCTPAASAKAGGPAASAGACGRR